MFLLFFVFFKLLVLFSQLGCQLECQKGFFCITAIKNFKNFVGILLTALDVGLHLSKYCTDDSQWKELNDENGLKWTEQGEKHKLCPDVPTIAPGVWTVPLVIACLGIVLMFSEFVICNLCNIKNKKSSHKNWFANIVESMGRIDYSSFYFLSSFGYSYCWSSCYYS